MSTLTFAHTRYARRPGYFQVFADRLRRRREFRALLSQPDYILKDIGVERHEIMREASKPFWFA
ncbi:MAG: DUF1127 domain-containing protein [Pseudomonadota bacterium]|nr:DUF1127 domain-containing protein [Pseudomonadota bacterium]